MEPLMNSSPMPRLLLVEDDPTSRAFLTAAAQALPADIDGADSVAAAVALGNAHDYDLWLFDANLPDGSGIELLARLRAKHPRTPALAHTAAADGSVLEGLIAAGFTEVLVKPLPAAMVRAAIARTLGLESHDQRAVATPAPGAKRPVWDDEVAASALNGNIAHADTLRGLFVQELPTTHEAVLGAAHREDRDTVRAELHKLRASCGFVGAARLADAVQALQNEPDSRAHLARFDEAVQDTLAAGA
jgi:CheY-like chemotaxis protein/HPt (histidine-containing phosphotransfer) domain-containing protein